MRQIGKYTKRIALRNIFLLYLEKRPSKSAMNIFKDTLKKRKVTVRIYKLGK